MNNHWLERRKVERNLDKWRYNSRYSKPRNRAGELYSSPGESASENQPNR
jgi:hypothetical protein